MLQTQIHSSMGIFWVPASNFNVAGIPLTPTNNFLTTAGCPRIQLDSETIYQGIALDFTV